jgi:hypothetical protein
MIGFKLAVKSFSISLFLAAILCGLSFAKEISYADIVDQLTNLQNLALLPADGQKCALWSSYNQVSKYDANTNAYIEWHRNGDGSGIIRMEGENQVIAEMAGPGCINRIWSATAGQGHLKIYLDGAETPAVDLPFLSYCDGSTPPFNRKSLVYIAAKGYNNYTPIPYQKSCKVVAEPNWGKYYQITYQTFPKDAIVPTFNMNLSAEDSAALDKADAILSNCKAFISSAKDSKEISKSITIEPGKQAEIFDINGPAAIIRLEIKPQLPTDKKQQEDLLRQLTIQMNWDNQKTPAVWSPLGDFFGTAPGINEYSSFTLGMSKDLFYSNWFMPFSKTGKGIIGNDSNTTFKADVRIVYAPIDANADYGRFHAKWHRDAFLPDAKIWPLDWTILKTKGRGKFCGVALHLWNPAGRWWGEGDERFFVDGEKFPSTFGTGTEDYFGYAWCCPKLFYAPYHNQTANTNNNNTDHISLNRWQIIDNVPFQKSFDGYIEKYFSNSRKTFYSAVSYWYLDAKGQDEYKPVAVGQRLGYYTRPAENVIANVAVSGQPTGGKIELGGLNRHDGYNWRDLDHLAWKDAKLGDKLNLELSADKDGKYILTGKFTKQDGYATVQLYLDNKKIGEPMDFQNDKLISTPELSLGKYDLKAGKHILTVEIIKLGPPVKATKYRDAMFGVDYVELKPM